MIKRGDEMLLELLRIIIIFMILGGLGWGILVNIYAMNEASEPYSWLGAIAILILLFVFYRNKLQFSGWYKGEGRVKLPKPVTITFILSSILLILLPFILGAFIH